MCIYIVGKTRNLRRKKESERKNELFKGPSSTLGYRPDRRWSRIATSECEK